MSKGERREGRRVVGEVKERGRVRRQSNLDRGQCMRNTVLTAKRV